MIVIVVEGFSDLAGGPWGFLWEMLPLVDAPGPVEVDCCPVAAARVVAVRGVQTLLMSLG